MKKFILLTLTTLAAAANAATLNLQETVNVEVPQDEMTAVFFVEQTGHDPAALNAKVAATLKNAFALSTDEVKVVSKGIYTHPVYGPNGKTNKYTLRASVEVKSTQLAQASKVSNQLAEFMAFETVRYAVSDATLKKVRDDQAHNVATRFMTKANALAKSLGYSKAEVDNIGLDVAAAQPMPRMMVKAVAMSAMMDSLPSPDMGLANAAGTESVTTTISGTVKLVN